MIARRDEALRIGHKDASLTMWLYADSQDEAAQDMVCGDPGWSQSIGDLGAGPLIAAIPGLSVPAPEPARRDQW